MVITAGGRPAYVVNVEVYLYRDGRWLLIQRSDQEAHAPGILAGPGGKVEVGGADPIVGVLEQTAVREALEEVGVELTGIRLSYVESAYFASDDGDPMVNVVFAGPFPGGGLAGPASPFPGGGLAGPASRGPGAGGPDAWIAAPEEVAAIRWLTADEAYADPRCPPWTRRALTKAERLRIDNSL